jgi:hypothetical protein
MYTLDPVNHPGWRLHQSLSVQSRWFGDQEFWLYDQSYPREDEPGADPTVMPPHGGFQEKGTFNQEGDQLTIASPSHTFDCTRRIRPVDPRSPGQQDEFLCVDLDGHESVWWGILWLEGATVDPECLALHDPPDLPTRYSLWERTDENGTSTFAHRVYDGRNFTATTQDLVLRKNGSAQIVKQVTGYIAETDRITWPSRTETALTWARSDRGLSLVLEGGSSMDCTFDENIGELGDAIRTFALACEGSDGVRTWWVPMDMTWPWGWGTHDTPYGWWWEAE